MEKAKRLESGPVKAIADTLERLAKEANRERQAIGYPEHHGKISYSNTVRRLAVEAFGHGFSLSVIAKAATVTAQTVQKWCKEEPQSSFRELRIVPTQIPGQEVASFDERREPSGDSARPLEFILPSGIRILVNRQDLDANLLGLFIGTKGV